MEAHAGPEAAIAEVVDLLTEMRQARGVARRGRFAVLATRAVAALTPEQRRQLAVDVASRAAPHLVEKIESESSVDLSPAQVRAVVEMVGNLDGDDLDSLKDSLQDPQFQRRAARRAMGAAAEAAELDLPAPEDDHTIQSEPTPQRTVARVEPPDGPREPPAPQVTPEKFAEYTPGLPEMADWRAEGADESQLSFSPRQQQGRALSGPRTGDSEPPGERSWFGDTSIGVGVVEPMRTELGERLRNVDGGNNQLRVFLAAAEEFAGMPAGEQVSSLRQLRAEWVRRRAVNAMIERGLIQWESARAVVGAFDSAVNQAWIVASLVEAGIGEVAGFRDLLTPAAAARLERRYAA